MGSNGSDGWAKLGIVGQVLLGIALLLVTWKTSCLQEDYTNATTYESRAHARAKFDAALDKSEELCKQCGEFCPPYSLPLHLNRAIYNEPTAEPLLTATDYNHLAMLGCSIWDFSTTKKYAEKALNNPRNRTTLDCFFAYLLLAHNHFKHLRDEPSLANIVDGRKYFEEAERCLLKAPPNASVKFNRGQGLALWAADEAFAGYSMEASVKQLQAIDCWKEFPQKHRVYLTSKVQSYVFAAKNGRLPELLPRFKDYCKDCKDTENCPNCVGEDTEHKPTPAPAAPPAVPFAKGHASEMPELPPPARKPTPIQEEAAPLPKAPKADPSA